MTDQPDEDRPFEAGDEYSRKGFQALQAGNREEAMEFYREAVEAYEAALAAAPGEDLLLVGNLKLCIGARRSALGEGDRALALYEEVIASLEGRPDLAAGEEGTELLQTARLNRADLRLGEGRTEEALREVEAILAEAPEHPYALHLLERCRGTME
jgi:tetratricopeptide (TPR) repeat protein